MRIEKEITLTGEELATEFWAKDDYEQAEFFNKNKFSSDNKDMIYYDGRALMQIDFFVDLLDDNGRDFIERIYSSLKGWHDMND